MYPKDECTRRWHDSGACDPRVMPALFFGVHIRPPGPSTASPGTLRCLASDRLRPARRDSRCSGKAADGPIGGMLAAGTQGSPASCDTPNGAIRSSAPLRLRGSLPARGPWCRCLRGLYPQRTWFCAASEETTRTACPRGYRPLNLHRLGDG